VSPPCGPHPVPLSTGSLEPSLLVSPSPRGPSRLKTFRAVLHLQQHELGRSLHLRTKPRVSPTPVVNHSSLRSGHPSTTGTLLVLTAAALGSSPSQDKSVDFLHSTQSVVNQVVDAKSAPYVKHTASQTS
jgi:hypothetical protein